MPQMKVSVNTISVESHAGHSWLHLSQNMELMNVDPAEDLLVITFASPDRQATIDKAEGFFKDVDNLVLIENEIRDEEGITLNEYIIFEA